MLEWIHERVFDPSFNVERLRQLCQIGDNNRSSRFRHLVGLGPRAYIEKLRLEAAVFLLERFDVAVLDVAYLVGYEHPQTFYRAFRRRFAATPGDVQQARRQR